MMSDMNENDVNINEARKYMKFQAEKYRNDALLFQVKAEVYEDCINKLTAAIEAENKKVNI